MSRTRPKNVEEERQKPGFLPNAIKVRPGRKFIRRSFRASLSSGKGTFHFETLILTIRDACYIPAAMFLWLEMSRILLSLTRFMIIGMRDSLQFVMLAARGDPISRPPAWMMRQAGRYMAVYRKLAEKHPSFRERSETTDLIVEISLQPWKAFQPDGVIIFSDILTPLPAFGVPFDIEEVRGPIIHSPICSEEGLKTLHPINLEKLHFVRESLKILRREMVDTVRKKCPHTPLVLYINGNGGLLECMKGTGVDVIGLDWTVDMADGRRRLGSGIGIQGNVDPAYLFAPLPALEEEIQRVVRCAGQRRHILNLGHGVLVGTPEDAVAHFFEVARGMKYDALQEDGIPNSRYGAHRENIQGRGVAIHQWAYLFWAVDFMDMLRVC
ncbi:hypothetical protein ACLOJK_010013 [Asimina triloba]